MIQTIIGGLLAFFGIVFIVCCLMSLAHKEWLGRKKKGEGN